MSVIISGKTPTFIATAPPRSAAPAPASASAPAATVEISAAARQAHSGGPGHAGKHGPRPLNIIWGDSPK